jgi:hypothetical protein
VPFSPLHMCRHIVNHLDFCWANERRLNEKA